MSPQTLFTMVSFHTLVLFFPVAMLVLWRRPQLWLHLLTLFLGAVTGLISLRTDDVQFPVLLLLVFAFFAGFVQPGRAWQFALLLALWVPLLGIITTVTGIAHGRPLSILGSLIAFIPALTGAYLGVLINRAAGPGAAHPHS